MRDSKYDVGTCRSTRPHIFSRLLITKDIFLQFVFLSFAFLDNKSRTQTSTFRQPSLSLGRLDDVGRDANASRGRQILSSIFSLSVRYLRGRRCGGGNTASSTGSSTGGQRTSGRIFRSLGYHLLLDQLPPYRHVGAVFPGWNALWPIESSFQRVRSLASTR
jgi:hypothetical protein